MAETSSGRWTASRLFVINGTGKRVPLRFTQTRQQKSSINSCCPIEVLRSLLYLTEPKHCTQELVRFASVRQPEHAPAGMQAETHRQRHSCVDRRQRRISRRLNVRYRSRPAPTFSWFGWDSMTNLHCFAGPSSETHSSSKIDQILSAAHFSRTPRSSELRADLHRVVCRI